MKEFAEKALEVTRGPELGLCEDKSDDPLAMFTDLARNALAGEEED